MEKLKKQLFESVLSIFENDDNKAQVENIVLNPIVEYIGKRLWPYIVSLSLSLCLLMILLAYVMYIMIHLQNNIRPLDPK